MFWVFLWLSVSWAEQLDHKVKKGKNHWDFKVVWRDSQRQKHQIRYSIASTEIKADRRKPTRYISSTQLNKEVVREVNRWARTVNTKKASVRAQHKWPGLTIYSSNGTDAQRRKKLMKQAQSMAERKQKKVLRRHGFKQHDDAIYLDYTRLTQQYSPKLIPLLRTLRQDSTRELATAILGYVQSIPYDKKADFRRPLSLLSVNAGDCDSKSVLMLSMLRAADVNVPLVIVLVRKHAFIGVGIPPTEGEKTASFSGVTYVLMEPVGPAMTPIGSISRRSQRALRKGKAKFIEVN